MTCVARDKREVINMLGGDKAPAIYKDFVEMLTANVARVKEIQGTIGYLQVAQGA